MDIRSILARCDHTLLRVDTTLPEIKALCDEAIKYGCASVCIPPSFVREVRKYVGSWMKVCTVIGFPNGYSSTAVKAYEAEEAIRDGADEIDMVINLGLVRDERWEAVGEDIAAVRKATGSKLLKVIIECCLLNEDEKKRLCRIVSDSGADYIKTSTGFSTGGATREDVALLREFCDASIKVKAAGGIKTLEDAEDFIELGADRLGTSRIVKLAMGMEQKDAKENY